MTKPTRTEFATALRRQYPGINAYSFGRGLRVIAPAAVGAVLTDDVERVGLTYRNFVPFVDAGVLCVRFDVWEFRRGIGGAK